VLYERIWSEKLEIEIEKKYQSYSKGNQNDEIVTINDTNTQYQVNF